MFDISLILSGVKAARSIVTEGIATLDEVMPDGGQGQAKLDILKGWVSKYLEAEAKYAPVASWVWTFLVPIVTAICARRKSASTSPGA